MSIDVSEVIWTVIDFFILLFLLNHFLYKPIVRFMDQRKRKIEDGMEAGATAQKMLQENQSQLQQNLIQRRSEAKKILADARLEDVHGSEQCHQEELALADAEKQKIREKIALEKSELDDRIQKQMPELVAILAGHVLQNEDAPRRNMDAIRDCVEETRVVS